MKLSKKNTILKNLIAINVSFFLVFSALNNVLSIQSVLNKTENLGTAGQLTIFTAQLFSCLVIPQLMIDKLGFKKTLAFAQSTYLIYVAANSYPRWYTIIPTAALTGFGNSLSWNVLGIYITNLSMQYSELTNKAFEAVQSLFFGIFTAIFLGASVLGSVLVATILKTEEIVSKNTTDFNYQRYCGINNCPADVLPVSASDPTETSIFILLGLLIFINILGILTTIFFIDNMKYRKRTDSTSEEEEKKPVQSIGSMFVDEFRGIIRLFGCLDTYLLFPMSVFTGFELTFIWTEFSRGFVTCLKSINYIGFTNILFGISGAIFSVLFGYLEKYTTQFTQIIFIFTSALGQGVFILGWTPSVLSASYAMFLIIFVFSVIESIATAQIRGLYGIQFPNIPAAFNIASIAQTIGFIGGFLCSLFVCIYIKIYVYLTISFISLITCTVLFSRNNYFKRKRQQQTEIDDAKKEELPMKNTSSIRF